MKVDKPLKKINKRKLAKKMDVLISKIVRYRATCAVPGCESPSLQCAHIYSRRNLHLRFDLLNLLPLCYRHHIHWAHKEPVEFTQWLYKGFPDRMAYLEVEKIKTETSFDYEGKYAELASQALELGIRI